MKRFKQEEPTSSTTVASHAAIQGSTESLRPIRRALISVSDKNKLTELGQFLAKYEIEILSTGGTAKSLREAELTVREVADFTGSPEMLDGRVKTLHPKIHGGILAVRGNAKHEADLKENGIETIDLVVINLYPFAQTVAKGAGFEECVENIDIGGPSMLRAAAKNYAGVVIISDPSQYSELMEEMQRNDGGTTIEFRRRCAAAAFKLSLQYEAAVATHFAAEVGAEPLISRTYLAKLPLKYGMNPHQGKAALYSNVETGSMPFKVLHGTPGYINFLDAAGAWQLVKELKEALNLAAAASFKHTSPAGAAVAVELNADEAAAYEIDPERMNTLTPGAIAYIRARNADPRASFGDFAALSEVVDEATAEVLKTVVSDGIVARGYTPEALKILKNKKSGNFIVLEADPNFRPAPYEIREVFGMALGQERNDRPFTMDDLREIVTQNKHLPDDVKRDLLLACITVKYTQSNSVGYAINGQMIGIGAGQQSRVDCVKLAGSKAETWCMRQDPKVKALQFKKDVTKQDRINARMGYIEGGMTAPERNQWLNNFETYPGEPLTAEDKRAFLAGYKKFSVASDAFLPFRDNVDQAAKFGGGYIAQTGGSNRDAEVTAACDEYGMAQGHTKVRAFHHG